MAHQLGLLPSGTLHCFIENLETQTEPGDLETVARLFAENKTSEGLFTLAALKKEVGLPPTFRFWRKFSSEYMTRRCHRPLEEQQRSLDPPEDGELQPFIYNLPPMKGAEYISIEVLKNIWDQLDQWISSEIETNFGTLARFLDKRAPHWHQVGRVCFHLAENKNDPDYPFAFMATYSPELSEHGTVRHLPLKRALEEYAGAKNKRHLINLLSPIQLASESSSLARELVESGDIYHPLAWRPQEAYRFLKELPVFETSGIINKLPNWWKKRPRPQVSGTIGTKSPGAALNAASLLNFRVEVTLGGETLTREEWKEILESQEGLVLIRGQWVEVDKEQLQEALSQWESIEAQAENEGLSFIEGMRLLAGAPVDLSDNSRRPRTAAWAFVQADEQLQQMLAKMRQPETLDSVLPQKQLKAILRPYQEVGVKWLWYLNQLGLGACLADDMGLGKTIQVISLFLILKQQKKSKPSLLVLPTSLLGNWKTELERFAPSLKCLFFHPSRVSKAEMDDLAHSKKVSDCDVVLTTYGMLLRQEWLESISWRLVVLDEAQAIKNPGTKQTKKAKKLKAESKIILTGTPIENRLSDLWSLYDFICPGLLGSATRFKDYVNLLDAQDNASYAPLRNLVQPYILRRLKTDKSIISDLPDKTEVNAYCSLTKEQARIYQQTVHELSQALQQQDGIQRRGIILAFLLRFKQICNHPSQLLGDGVYDPLKSGKFSRLAEISEEISLRQEKLLVFTQFREICDPLESFLSHCFGQPGMVLHGGTPAQKRQAMVEAFQQEEGPPFFVLSIKAGGTGLNLTAASHVIHFDRWWNPAVENQATDRAFRIGQKKNVLVHKFICPGTIEEKIDAIITEKSALADNLLGGDGAERLLTEMSDQELINMVTLDLDKAML
ncbi:MAG: DEAD/DEAH box helicase [SAR324 cluster bacterium]|nr:DEAD/DEAH box helicase [SAR324 cluster bacterium]